MKTTLIRTLVFLALLLFSPTAYAQNFDFEEWEYNSSIGGTSGSMQDSVPKHWSAGWSAEEEKTTDAYSGDYALRIYRWYNVVIGRAIIGELPDNTMGEYDIINSGLPISGKPTKLNGYYKYVNVNPGDSAGVIVILKKWNTTTNKTDTIAYGRTLLDSIDVYTSFSVNIEDLMPGVQPDSIVIGLYSALIAADGGSCARCSYLYIDSLFLEGGSVLLGSNNIEKKKVNVNVYPNPFSESTSVEITNLESINKNVYFTLYNVLGEKVRTIPVKPPIFKIQKENLQQGVYFYQVHNDNLSIANGKIVVE